MLSEKELRKLEVKTVWNGEKRVCMHCGKVPEVYFAASAGYTTSYFKWCNCRKDIKEPKMTQIKVGQVWECDGAEFEIIDLNEYAYRASVKCIKAGGLYKIGFTSDDFNVLYGHKPCKLIKDIKEPKMNTNKLEQTVADLQAALEKAKKDLEDAKDVSWPKMGDDYFYLSAIGEVGEYKFENHLFDLKAFSIGNCFKTREEAESEVFARKVIQELKQCKGVKKFTEMSFNYCIKVSLPDDKVLTNYWQCEPCGLGQVYFNSEQDVLNAIQKVGSDKILKAAKWLACGEVVK